MTTAPAPNHVVPHSDLGGSTAPRLIACPGSFALARRAPRRTGGGGSSIYAATGTVAHLLAEESIQNGVDPAAELGVTLTVDGHDVTVDEEMVEAVRIYADECRARAAGASLSGLETKVSLDLYWTAHTVRPPVPAFGWADFWAYHGASLHLDLVDYKNGAGVYVDAASDQLYYYAAGLLLMLELLGQPAPITVDLTVVQPNIRGQQKTRVHRTTALDVMLWLHETYMPAVAEALQPGARIVGGDHCRFCPARAVCPELTRLAQELARRDFGPGTDEPVVLSPSDLSRVLRDQELVAPHLLALQEIAQEKISAGDTVPNWSLVPSRPVRSWTASAHELVQALAEAGHHDAANLVFAPATARTPAQMEKVLSPEQWAVIEPFVQSRSSGLRLSFAADDPAQTSGRTNARDDFA